MATKRPATVIIDTQNVYGNSGDLFGYRYKPDPEGVVRAFARLGLEVDRVEIAVALPEANDIDQVRSGLRKHGIAIDQIRAGVSRLGSIASPAVGDLFKAAEAAASALAALTLGAASGLRERLEDVNQVAQAARQHLRAARTSLQRALALLEAEGRGARLIPGDHIRVAFEALRLLDRLDTVTRDINAISSYAYAGRGNLDFAEHVGADGGLVRRLEGRFRPGQDGGGPGEKQIDTLCAVAAVDATRAAVEAGEARCIVVLSDDDDLSPALRRAAVVASGTSTTVLVAGTDTVRTRFERQAGGRDCPGWLVLDMTAWSHVVGHDPANALMQRNQYASLALGNPCAFMRTEHGVVTRFGLRARLHGPCEQDNARLWLCDLRWLSERGTGFPTPVVTAEERRYAPGAKVRVQRAARRALTPRNIPVDRNRTPVDAAVGAPGWWMSGDELVVVDAPGAGRRSHLLGDPEHSLSLEERAHAVVATVESVDARGASVVNDAGRWWVHSPQRSALRSQDQVVVVPYERSGRRRPDGGRSLPVAVLCSSAL
jgi:hypothetical protein